MQRETAAGGDRREGSEARGNEVIATVNKNIALQRRAYHEAQKADSISQRQSFAAQLRDSHQKQIFNRPSLPIARTALASAGSNSSNEPPAQECQGSAKGSSTHGEEHRVRLMLLPKEDSLPRYKTWSYLPQNEIALQVGRKMFYTDSQGETIPASDSDEETKGDDSLEGIYRQRDIFVTDEVVKQCGRGDEVVQCLARSLHLTHATVASLIKQLSEEASAGGETIAPPMSKVYDDAFCRSCRLYKCLVHRRASYRSLRKPPALDSSEDQQPCGQTCWRNAGSREDIANKDNLPPERVHHPIGLRDLDISEDRAVPSGTDTEQEGRSGQSGQWPEDWSVLEREQFVCGQAMFGRDSCKIARFLGSKTCSQVAETILKDPASVGEGHESDGLLMQPGMSLSRRKRSSSRQSQPRKVVQKRSQHTEALWEEYTPCNCPGGCGADCSCLDKAQFCQKFCACDPSCVHFFPGCACQGSCRTKTCPCFAAGMECDPDLCKVCCGNITGEELPAGKERCLNMRLRLRQHKRIAVGLSSIAGWGAFLLEPAMKGELIGEYTGELVDQKEAERRGKVYDRDDNSYLFNLNLSWVIDARMRGNKLRFANHSLEPNCGAKILMVDGDHRVGIFALKDLVAGQELLYNYMYTQEQAPDWAKIRRCVV